MDTTNNSKQVILIGELKAKMKHRYIPDNVGNLDKRHAVHMETY